MDLSEQRERERLLQSVRDKLGGAVTKASDEDLEHWIAGYPGVLEWWDRMPVRKELYTPADVAAAASDAHAGRYIQEFERVLAPLFERNLASFSVAVRLALLPKLVSEAQWEALQALVLKDEGLEVLTVLQVYGVLDAREPHFPSYGHSTRHEAVQRWLIASRYLPLVRREAEWLTVSLAVEIRGLDHAYHPQITALRALRPVVDSTGASPATGALIEAAISLDADGTAAWQLILKAVPRWSYTGAPAVLLSMALFNAINERSRERDGEGRRALLDAFRVLANAHPDEPAVRKHLSMALFDAMNDFGREGDHASRKAALDDLRDLATRYPDDRSIRENLARGLYTTIILSSYDGDREREKAVYSELRDLSDSDPDDQLVAAVLNEVTMVLLFKSSSPEVLRAAAYSLLPWPRD